MARSNKDKSAIVSAAGFQAAWWLELNRRLRAGGLSGEEIYDLLNANENEWDGAAVLDEVAALMIGHARRKSERSPAVPSVILDPRVFPVTLDPSMSWQQLLEAGRYDSTPDSEFTQERFPFTALSEMIPRELLLVKIVTVKGTEAERILEAAGYTLAGTRELLAFGAEHPDVQREFHIIAAAKSACWRGPDGGYTLFPYLCRSGRERIQSLDFLERPFGSVWRWLVFRTAARNA